MVDGVLSAGYGGLLSSGSGDILDQIRQAGKDPIKALVVRINSPGGSAATSWEIYEELKRVRESGKVVVVSMADVAASGGYAVACAADFIVANPATVTGSIGVIIDATNMEDLYQLLGINYEAIKSGDFKDTPNPARSLDEQEKALLQTMVDDIYEQFLDIVTEGRGLSREEVLPYADGRVLTGRQAQAAGLVDELGTFQDAVNIAARMSGIQGEPQIYRYRSGDIWNRFFTGAVQDTNLSFLFLRKGILFQ